MWIYYAFTTAFFEGLKDVYSKKIIKHFDEFILSWAVRFFSLIILLPLLLYNGIPEISPRFYLGLSVSVFINIVTTLLYMKAIKTTDISISIPFLSFTPIFLIFTSPLFLNEFINLYGIIGIICIVIGSYIINLNKIKEGFYAPFKYIFINKGCRYILLVAFLWSISSNFDKIGVLNSSPIFYIFCANFLISLFFMPYLFLKNSKKIDFKTLAILSLTGIFSGIAIAFQMLAIKSGPVAYVISIKRTSIIFVVIFATVFLKEKNFTQKFIGIILMILGIFIINFLR